MGLADRKKWLLEKEAEAVAPVTKPAVVASPAKFVKNF